MGQTLPKPRRKVFFQDGRSEICQRIVAVGAE